MKPIVYEMEPFDATLTVESHLIKFKWQGQVLIGNRCVIKENETGTVSYDKTVTSSRCEHEIDASHSSYKLQNGKTYNVTIQPIIQGNTYEGISSPVFLKCFSTPVMQFTNLQSNISITSYDFEFTYSQAEGELLESYEVTLYDSGKNQLRESGKKYVSSSQSNLTLTYGFNNFENSKTYYVRARGKTINGMDADTGYEAFSVQYSFPQVFSYLEAENDECLGGIRIYTHFKPVEHQLYTKSGKAVPDDDAIYIDLPNNDRAVDLTNHKLVYYDGYSLEDKWSLMIICSNIKVNDTIVEIDSENDPNTKLKLVYREGRNGSDEYSGHFELIASTNINGKKWNRIYTSNNLDAFSIGDYSDKDLSDLSNKIISNLPDGNAMGKWYGVHIRKLNNLYSVYCATVTKNDV